MYLRLIKHIFLLALFVIPQCFANEINGDYLVRKALQELLQKGDPDKVGDLLEKANSQYPNFKLANYLQAEYYSALDNYQALIMLGLTLRLLKIYLMKLN